MTTTATVIVLVMLFVFAVIGMYFIIEYQTVLTLYDDLKKDLDEVVTSAMDIIEYTTKLEQDNERLSTQLRNMTEMSESVTEEYTKEA